MVYSARIVRLYLNSHKDRSQKIVVNLVLDCSRTVVYQLNQNNTTRRNYFSLRLGKKERMKEKYSGNCGACRIKSSTLTIIVVEYSLW